MTTVKMTALDTVHITAVGPENILAGEQFEVPEGVANELEQRGVAKRIGGKAKAEPVAPENKMEAAPANKAEKPLISAKSVPSKNTATAKRKAK